MTTLDNTGIYVHIPYCAGKCPYCDFYSRVAKTCPDEYVNALCDEMQNLERMKDFVKDSVIVADTLYFGGGTPSLLSPEQLKKLITTAKKSFGIKKDAEITVECNPSSKNLDAFLYEAAQNGVNRVSLGMQSFSDSERRILGRHGTAESVENAVNTARQAGIDNISLDIMVGVPESSMSSLKRSLDAAISFSVKHISAYILKIEEDTYFGRNADKLSLPDEDEVCDMYLFMSDYLTKNGFSHYEVSNFCKDGFYSRHNMKYWENAHYLGFGAAAHSYFNGKRFFFPRDTEKFMSGLPPVFDGEGGDDRERILLGLRTFKGISLENKNDKFVKKAKEFVKYGLAEIDGSRFFLTAKGYLVSNTVISELLFVY